MILKKCIIVNKATGIVAFKINATMDTVLANLDDDHFTLEGEDYYDAAGVGTHYWDENTNKFVEIPPAPALSYAFDPHSKTWIDLRELDDVKDSRWGKLKIERDALEFGGFEFEGHRYDSDTKSQGRISAAASLGVPVEWTLQDNSTVWMEQDDLKRLVAALAMHVTQVHARGKVAREAIQAATTIEEVEAIVF